MLNPTQLKELSTREQRQCDNAVMFIVERVTSMKDKYPSTKHFRISMSELTSKVGKMSVKVRNSVFADLDKKSWKAEFSDNHIVLSAKRKYSRKNIPRIEKVGNIKSLAELRAEHEQWIAAGSPED